MILRDASFMGLDGKVAIVTGSTRGIGHAIALDLVQYGAIAVITGRKQEACDKVVKEINDLGGTALGVACDVTKQSDREMVVEKAVAAFGHVDILVNNAGLGGQIRRLKDMDEEYFDNYVSADYKSVYFMSQAFVKQVIAQGRPEGKNPYRIINLSSAAAIKAPIGDTVYGSLKASITQLTRIMANELARYGVLCTSIAPGYVNTDMIKDVLADEKNVAAVNKMIAVRRYAEPSEIASVVSFLASDAAGYVTGVQIPVDGGMTLS